MPGAVPPDALRVAELIAMRHDLLNELQGSKE